MSKVLTVMNQGKTQLIDNVIVKGFALANVDVSGGLSIGFLTDEAGNVSPELFPTTSQARKERDTLIKTMDYTKSDFLIAPANWCKNKNKVTLYSRRNSKALATIPVVDNVQNNSIGKVSAVENQSIDIVGNSKSLNLDVPEFRSAIHSLPELAAYHFYFTTEVLKRMPAHIGDNVGDIFSLGEDSFVMELYAISQMLYLKTDKAHEDGHCFIGVPLYELPGILAEKYWSFFEAQDYTKLTAEMPSLNDLEPLIDEAILQFLTR